MADRSAGLRVLRVVSAFAALAVLFPLALEGVAWAQGKPKAVVITGRATDAADKAWDDKTAAEAKKDLEAAGYDVEVLSEPDKDTALAKIKDPATSALVVISHGRPGEERVVMKKANGDKDPLLGTDLTGPFDNIKIATIHACDQDQASWKAKFPKADFKSWTGCVFSSAILEWQKKKEYAPADTPKEDQETLDMHPLLENGQFITDDDGSRYAMNPLAGNWMMSPALAQTFGNQSYNFLVLDSDLTNPEILFNAQVSNGAVQFNAPDQVLGNADFNIYFTDDLYTDALKNPFVLLDPNLLGTRAFIEAGLGNQTSPQVLLAGVAKNIFNIDTTLPNGGVVSEPPLTLLLGLALLSAGWLTPRGLAQRRIRPG